MTTVRKSRASLAGPGLGALLALLAGPALARTCPEIYNDMVAARQGTDLQGVIALYNEAHTEGTGCNETFLSGFGNEVALAHLDGFYAALDAEGDSKDVKRRHLKTLKDAQQYGRPWQLLSVLAQVEYELGDHDSAANFYQQTLAAVAQTDRDITGGPAKENLPSPEEFKDMYEKMSQSALLAEDFSPPAPPATRDITGPPPIDGMFVESYRGFVPAAVPVPIEFVVNSARPTAKGDKALKHLTEYLLTSGLTTITLVGHTDPSGSPSFNQTLSLARARFVAKALKDGGFTGTIQAVGKGEEQPFAPKPPELSANDPASLQLDRRVELVR